jgi:hypothetical protein
MSEYGSSIRATPSYLEPTTSPAFLSISDIPCITSPLVGIFISVPEAVIPVPEVVWLAPVAVLMFPVRAAFSVTLETEGGGLS